MEINYLFFACVALVTVFSGAEVPWTDDDEESLAASLELDEFDFDDVCKSQVMPYEWDQITGQNEDSSIDALQQFAESQRKRAIVNSENKKEDFPLRTAEVARKLELVSFPGDIILPDETYTKLLEFSADVAKTITKRHIDCEQASPISCDLTSGDSGQLLETWKKLAVVESEVGEDDLRTRYPELLQLTSEAAEANGSPNVESYWLMLSELEENGYGKAKSLWEEVKPLYQNLHRWVTKSLRAKYGSDVFASKALIPSYLLGTRLGNDWTSIAELVLTENCKDVYDQIKTSLADNKMSGKLLYRTAETMTGFLNVGNLSRHFWSDSLFEQTCPAKLVDPCRAEPRVAGCNQSTWSNYLDTHAITMQSIQSQLHSSSQLSYLMINGNRFSAIDSAVTGLATLIASNRHYLSQQSVLNMPKNTCLKEALLTLVALRELPKLPYYLVADLARLEAIKTNRTMDIGKIWRQFMSDNAMQGLSTPESEWWGFIEDPHISSNRPFISQFYGVFLQFHLYQELLEKDEETSADAAPFVRSTDQLRSLLELGISKKWPQLLSDTFHITKITAAPLLQYFSSLDQLSAPLPKVTKELPTTPPKEARTLPAVVPTPITRVVADANVSNNATVTNSNNVTLTNATSEMKLREPSTDTVEEAGGDTITFVLIGCGVVVAIALTAFLVNYGRRKYKKSREYQRPTNQPA